jgi:hypothetical protein
MKRISEEWLKAALDDLAVINVFLLDFNNYGII